MTCPGYDPARVRPMSDEAHVRLTAEGTASAYHRAPAHPHLFCGCGSESADCHPGRCCVDADDGCGNCGRPSPVPAPVTVPESDLTDPLFEIREPA